MQQALYETLQLVAANAATIMKIHYLIMRLLGSRGPAAVAALDDVLTDEAETQAMIDRVHELVCALDVPSLADRSDVLKPLMTLLHDAGATTIGDDMVVYDDTPDNPADDALTFLHELERRTVQYHLVAAPLSAVGAALSGRRPAA